MKRLFRRFEIETGLVTLIMDGKDTSYQDRLSKVSSEFNEWMEHLWSKVGPASSGRSRYPFGERVNKLMVRKWVEKMEVERT